jgi:hypothetical protein
VTIASIDAEVMYPSIKYSLIKKAIEHYTDKTELDEQEEGQIQTCLEFIKFGMSNTIITFVDRYYMYDGDLEIEDRGLTIGGYESAWLADLAIAYIVEKAQEETMATLKHFGIYRDDGIGVFPGNISYADGTEWLNKFQEKVDEITGNDWLQFTMEIWKAGEHEIPDIDKKSKVQINNGAWFPFLDMEMSWNNEGDLEFGVHLKQNQLLKYPNKGSSHTPGCFKAIPYGVKLRLASLTTVTEENRDKKLSELYPAHFEALDKAGILHNIMTQ